MLPVNPDSVYHRNSGNAALAFPEGQPHSFSDDRLGLVVLLSSDALTIHRRRRLLYKALGPYPVRAEDFQNLYNAHQQGTDPLKRRLSRMGIHL